MNTKAVFSPRTDWEHVFRYGLTADLCQQLVAQSRSEMDREPASIYWYAVWHLALDLQRQYRDDEQGIPVEEGQTIDEVVLTPLRAFLEAGGLFDETPKTSALLADLLRARWELRTAMSLYR